MNLHFHSRNTLEVETSPDEVFYYHANYLRAGASTVPPLPPFWSSCLLGRLIHGKWVLRQSPFNKHISTIISGGSPTGGFETLKLGPGEKAFINLEHLAGFVVPLARLTGDPHVLHPVLGSVLRPASWAMGHPVPCVFEGPATVILDGAALRWENQPLLGEYKPSQVIAFDATCAFEVKPMQPGSNWLSLVYNALTFESRFVTQSPRLLVEDYIAPPKIRLHALKHFMAHAALAAFLAFIFWLRH